MKSVALLSRLGALCVVMLCLPLVAAAASAPATAVPPSADTVRPLTPEELAQAELLRSFLQLRDQLQAAQLAIVNNRVEAETNARVQTAAIAEKLEAIKAAMAVERDRHQAETQRLMIERERQQVETQRSMRTVLWVAAAFGAFGLIAVLLAPFLQMRAMNRISDLAGLRPELMGGSTNALLPPDGAPLPDRTVTQSNGWRSEFSSWSKRRRRRRLRPRPPRPRCCPRRLRPFRTGPRRSRRATSKAVDRVLGSRC
jgi:hypothetical protein